MTHARINQHKWTIELEVLSFIHTNSSLHDPKSNIYLVKRSKSFNNHAEVLF